MLLYSDNTLTEFVPEKYIVPQTFWILFFFCLENAEYFLK